MNASHVCPPKRNNLFEQREQKSSFLRKHGLCLLPTSHAITMRSLDEAHDIWCLQPRHSFGGIATPTGMPTYRNTNLREANNYLWSIGISLSTCTTYTKMPTPALALLPTTLQDNSTTLDGNCKDVPLLQATISKPIPGTSRSAELD